MAAPSTRFAPAGQVDIAHQVIGDGPVDLVWVGGLCSNIEVLWEEPRWAALMRRLSEFCRLIVFDRRGSGVSDRGGGATTPTVEERLADITAVLDAVESQRAALFGFSEGGLIAAMYAATYPDRVSRLILYGTIARFLRDGEHPWGWREATELEAFIALAGAEWGTPSVWAAQQWAPSLAEDERFVEWLAKWARQSLSRGDVTPFLRSCLSYDMVDVFPAVRVPSLVLHRTGDELVPVRTGRRIAEKIPGARLVELPGHDHFPFAGDAEAVVTEVERFLRGRAVSPTRTRLLTIVAAEIADPSPTARLTDSAWREQLEAQDHEVAEQLARYGGRLVKKQSERVLAVFDAPARAIRCATGMVDEAHRRGPDVRVGIHCGECEVNENDIHGLAVSTATRMASRAAPGEVLVSGTVRDLVPGSGIRFVPGRDVDLPAASGRQRAFAVVTDGTAPDEVRRLTGDRANVLRCDGEYWTIAYDGQVITLQDTKGIRDLAVLLAAPAREVHVLDLVADRTPQPTGPAAAAARQAGLRRDRPTGDPVIDATAREAYRRRITDLEESMAAAEDLGDAEAVTRARAERDTLLEHLTAAYGLGGRTRGIQDHVERARKAVSRRIGTVLTRLDEVHPALGTHLRNAVQTGVFCSYRPDRALHWVVGPR